jgi:hypothetical protein
MWRRANASTLAHSTRTRVDWGERLQPQPFERSVSMFRARSQRERLSVLIPVVLVAAVAILVAPRPAGAQVVAGVRGGVSIDPDQAYFGGHVETVPLVERLHFRPSVELGFGDHRTLLALNGEFVWRFPEGRAGWTPYAGGGPAINGYWYDRKVFPDGDADMKAGFNVLGGFEYAGGLFFEFKVGGFDSPRLKLGVGYTWR